MDRKDLTRQGFAPAAGSKAYVNPIAIAVMGLIAVSLILLFAFLRVVHA